jgi:hypothetical protein
MQESDGKRRGRPKSSGSPISNAVRRLKMSRNEPSAPSFSGRSTSQVTKPKVPLIDCTQVSLFSFDSAFGGNDQMALQKLKASGLLVPEDDLELYRCPKCVGSLLRAQDSSRVLSYRNICNDSSCKSSINPASNTWFEGLRSTKDEPNPLLRSLRLLFALVCNLPVTLAVEQTRCNRLTARKIYRNLASYFRPISVHQPIYHYLRLNKITLWKCRKSVYLLEK